jgi:hypothetical protein
MNQSIEQLAERLQQLPLDHPQPKVVTTRVLAAAADATAMRHFTTSGRRVRSLRSLAIAAAVLLAALPVAWGVLYFSPATAAALADASGPGGFSREILDNFGLGTGSGVTAQSSSASSSGYKVQLVGAYADSIRTVILLNVTPAASAGGFQLRLTDQFGTTYQFHGSEGNLLSGDQALDFERASGLASVTGLRFTLSFDELTLLSSQNVSGAWTVKGIVLLHSGTNLNHPAAGSLGAGTVTFTEVRYSGRVVLIRADVRGVSLAGEVPAVAPGTKPRPRFNIELAPADGSATSIHGGGGGWSSSGDVTELRAMFFNVDPGTYFLTLSLDGAGTLQRTLVVR